MTQEDRMQPEGPAVPTGLSPLPPRGFITAPLTPRLSQQREQSNERLERLVQESTDLRQRSGQMISEVVDITQPTNRFVDTFKAISPAGLILAQQALAERILRPLPFNTPLENRIEQERAELHTLESQLVEVERQLYGASWEVQIIDALPTLVQAGLVSSTDDALNISGIDIGSYPEARQFIDSVLPVIVETEERRQREGEALVEDIATGGGDIFRLLNLPTTSDSDQLVASILDAVSYNLPRGVTPEQVRETLVHLGYNEGEADDRVVNASHNAFMLGQELRQWTERSQRLLIEGQRINGGEIISAIRREQWKRAITQPALIVLRPVEWWNENVVEPAVGSALGRPLAALGGTEFGSRIAPILNRSISGALQTSFSLGQFNHPIVSQLGVKGLPELDLNIFSSAKQSAEWYMHVNRAKTEGFNSWQAQGYAWRNNDTNALVKFLLETAFDPLTYVGLGITSKALRPLPMIGRQLAAWNEGFALVADLPFRQLREAYIESAPRTIAQKSQTAALDAFDLFRHGYEQHSSGRPFFMSQPEELKLFAEVAVREAVNNPNGMDELTQAGRALMGQHVITADELGPLMRQLGISEQGISVPLMDNINNILELTEGFGSTKFLNLDEAAPIIARQLGVADLDTAPIRQFLRQRQQTLARRALNPFNGADAQEISVRMVDEIAGNYQGALKSQVLNRRYSQGIVGRMLVGLEKNVQNSFLASIDRFYTRTWPQAMLMFGAYSVQNINEAAIKTLLGGVNPLFRGARTGEVFTQSQVLFHGIEGHLPPQVISPHEISFDLNTMEASLTELGQASRRRGMSPARQALDRYTRAWNEGRAWQEFWRGMQEVTGFNFGRRMAAAQLTNYTNRMYKKLLTDYAPDVMDEISDLVGEALKPLQGTVSRDVFEGFREALEGALSTGDLQAIDNVINNFTPGRVHAGIVDKALDPYTELPTDVIDFIAAQAESGRIWDEGGINRVRNMMRERVYQHYFSSVGVLNDTIGEVVDAVLEMPVRTRFDLQRKMKLLEDTAEVFSGTVSNTLDSAMSYTRLLRNSEDRGVFLNEVWGSQISPQVTTISSRMSRAIQQAKSELPNLNFTDGTPLEVKDQFEALYDNLITKVENWREARTQQVNITREYFTEGGARYQAPKDRGNSFWNGYRDEVSAVWDDARERSHQINRGLLQGAINLEGTPTGQLPDLTKRPMTALDVAGLLGVQTYDMERGLYLDHLTTVMRRDDFISLVMNKASMSNPQPSNLGWTEDTIGGVYDSMVEKIMINPRVREGVEPLMQQLDAALSEVSLIGQQRGLLMPPDIQEQLQRVGEFIKGEAFPIGSGVRAPQVISNPVRVSIKSPKQLMLPSAEPTRQAERSNFKLALDSTREDLANAQRIVDENVSAITGLKRRNPDAVGSRLARLRDNLGVDISTPDELLNEYRFVEGRTVAARERRSDLWQRMLDSLVTLDIDIEAGVRDTARRLEQSMTGTGQTVTEIIGIQEYREQLGALGLPHGIAEAFANMTGERFSANAWARLIGRDRDTVRALVRGGFLKRSGDKLEAAPPLLQKVRHTEEHPLAGSIEFSRDVIPNYGTFTSTADIKRPILALLDKAPDSSWQKVRTQALEETNIRRAMDFPDWENQTAVSAVMKHIFPFWGYEAHRWTWWLPREMIRHPGVVTGWGRYQDSTDQGYIHIPGTSLDINPFRGTIFMGGGRRLFQRDYPEFHDSFPHASEFIDYIGRWGFYPGAHVGLAQSLFGSRRGPRQFGELLPSSARTILLDTPSAIAPEQTRILRELIFPDRFRDYLVATEVSRLEIDKATGFDGTKLMRKRLLEEELTPEEQAVWDRASRGIATWQILFEQTGLFRFMPEEKLVARDAALGIIEAHTGVPKENLVDMRRSGIRMEEIIGAQDPELKRKIRALEAYQRFAGGTLALQPSREGQTLGLIQEFWETVDENLELSQDNMESAQAQFEQGEITYSQWEQRWREKLSSTTTIIDDLRTLPKFEGVPITLEERKAFAEERGITMFLHPTEELRNVYFNRDLEMIEDIDTGLIVPDYDSLLLYREVVEQSIPERHRGEFLDLIRRNNTPMEVLRRDIQENFFRPYNDVADVVLQEFGSEDQIIINKLRLPTRLLGEDERKELRAMQFAGEDTTIWAEFQRRVRTAHTNMRQTDPELDAWLVFFEKADRTLSTAAQGIFTDLVDTLAVRGVNGLIVR